MQLHLNYFALSCDQRSKRRIPVALILVGLGLITGIWALGLSGLQYERLNGPKDHSTFSVPPSAWSLKGQTDNFLVEDETLTITNQPGENNSIQYQLPLANSSAGHWIEFTSILDSDLVTTNDRPALHASWFLHSSTEERVGVDLHTDLTQRLEHAAASDIRKIPPNVNAVVASYLLRDSYGKLSVQSAQIVILQQSTIFQILAFTLAILVALWFGWLAFRMLSDVPLIYCALVLTTLAVLVAGATLSEGLLENVIRPVTSYIFSLAEPTWALTMENLFDFGHALVFFVFGMSILHFWRTRQESLSHCLALLAIFAIGTEGLQLFLPHRHPSLSDVVINSAGIVVAVISSVIIRITTIEETALES